MAEEGRMLLRAPPPDIYYKCHPNRVVSVIICVVCNSVYHKSDHNPKKPKQFLNGLQMICDEHNIDDITSKN